MMRAHTVLAPGSFDEACDEVVLDHEGRHRRRIVLEGRGGTRFLLDLPEAVALADGAGLRLDDGRVVAVRAAPEPLMAVAARDALHLARLAWHIGNRHLPATIDAGRILIRRDHVIADMIRGLGGSVEDVEAPFEPEGGAYARQHGDDHDHG